MCVLLVLHILRLFKHLSPPSSTLSLLTITYCLFSNSQHCAWLILYFKMSYIVRLSDRYLVPALTLSASHHNRCVLLELPHCLLFLLQAWFLLYLLLPLFLPKRQLFVWYLKEFLSRRSCENNVINDLAQHCENRLIRTQKNGVREKKPSWFEVSLCLTINMMVPPSPL